MIQPVHAAYRTSVYPKGLHRNIQVGWRDPSWARIWACGS